MSLHWTHGGVELTLETSLAPCQWGFVRYAI